MSESQNNRTTVHLSDAVHKRLKILAVERDTTMQDLIEAALTHIIDGGLDREPARARGKLAVPAHLERVVSAFLEYWQRSPETATDQQIRRLIETVIGTTVPKQK